MSASGVGDRGQRYEVRYTDAATGEEKVMGWTDQADGGGLLRSALLAAVGLMWTFKPWKGGGR